MELKLDHDTYLQQKKTSGVQHPKKVKYAIKQNDLR